MSADRCRDNAREYKDAANKAKQSARDFQNEQIKNQDELEKKTLMIKDKNFWIGKFTKHIFQHVMLTNYLLMTHSSFLKFLQ